MQESSEFQKAMQSDAATRLDADLEALLAQLTPQERGARAQEFNGFARLFARFLKEKGPSVDWDRIEKLPAGAVSRAALATPPSEIVTLRLRCTDPPH